MESHTLRKFTEARIDEVQAEWSELAGEDEVAVEMSAVFDWARANIEKRDGHAQAMELYNIERQSTEAIIEIVNSRWGSLTKLLKVYYSPPFWGLTDRDEAAQLVAGVFSKAFSQVLAKNMSDGTVQEVKVYGREAYTLLILQAVADVWLPESPWSAGMEGRWLAMKRK